LLVAVLVVGLLAGGYVPAAAQEADGAHGFALAPEAAAGAGGAGRSEPGRKLDLATLAAQVSADDDAAAVGAARAVPRLSDLGPAALAALKRAVERGELAIAADAGLDADDAGVEAAEVAPMTPIQFSEFAGIAYTGSIPPDPHIAVGPSDLIVAVNRTWRIYNKSGTQLFNSTLLSWFSNVLPSPNTGISVFDPWVLYDDLSDRFVLLALAKRDSDQLSRFLISVSDNNVAQGNWCNWSLDAKLNGSTNTSNWADYAKVGVNSNAIVISANMFSPFTGTATFQYAKLRFLSKSQIYNTSCPGVNWWDFWNLTHADGTKEFTVQPAHSYVNSNLMYFLSARSSSGSSLTRRLYTTSATIPPAPTFGGRTTITVNSYSIPPDAQQPGTSTRIDTGDARLLNVARQSNGRLWAAHTVACTWSGDPTTRSCVRWYEINPSTSAVVQQRSYGAATFFYYYPAIMPRSTSDAMVVFNRSSTSTFAGIRYTGRKSTDPLNDLQNSSLLEPGQGCYVKLDSLGRNRWGDYNGIAIDPSVSGRWWIYSEYVSGTSATCSNNVWATRVGQVGLS
jgi:hypothetical protein